MKQYFGKRLPLASLILIIAALVSACAGPLPGSESLVTPTPQESSPVPVLTATPEPTLSPVPTAFSTPTPVPTTAPAITEIPLPTPPDVSGYTNGGYNACAKWDENGELTETAPAEVGSMIYCNNFEREEGNRLADGNDCNEVEIICTDKKAAGGLYSYRISKRKQAFHGLSGLGFRLDERNGIRYKDLIGKTIRIHVSIFYEDEGFGSADTLEFALYDGYHTETVKGYQYERRDGSVVVDSHGIPILVDQERAVLKNSCTVKRGVWTECDFYLMVEDTNMLSKGYLMLATVDEAQNSVGLFSSYYIDDLSVTVISPKDIIFH